MFRLIEPSPGQIRNILLVHSVSAHCGIPHILQNCIDIKDLLLSEVFKRIYKNVNEVLSLFDVKIMLDLICKLV